MVSHSVIIDKLEKCYLPKLSENFDQCEKHKEFECWDKNLTENVPGVIELINQMNSENSNTQSTVISSLLLLYFQLHNEDRWKTEKSEEFAKKINYQFQFMFDTSLADFLKSTKKYDRQRVFDKSMEILHQRLTPNDFKKYPALIEAYYSIIKNIKDYEVIVKPVSLMPVSLLLIEDYIHENRVKGLRCFAAILKCLTPDHFTEGNYYEVLNRTLKKILLEKDLELTKLVLECHTDLIAVLPSSVKVSLTDETLGIVLDQMYTESNLYRKGLFFVFINKIIPMHGVHCVKRNMFLPVICDNLDICSNEAIEKILLRDVVECLENWIRYCWCVWQLSQNKKLMSLLVKMLYVKRDDAEMATKIQNILLVLCKLSTEEEQKEICNNLEKAIHESNSFDQIFTSRLNHVISDLSLKT